MATADDAMPAAGGVVVSGEGSSGEERGDTAPADVSLPQEIEATRGIEEGGTLPRTVGPVSWSMVGSPGFRSPNSKEAFVHGRGSNVGGSGDPLDGLSTLGFVMYFIAPYAEVSN